MLAPTYQTTSCHMHFLTEEAVKIVDTDTHSCDVTRSRRCQLTQLCVHTGYEPHTHWHSFDFMKVKTSNKLYITEHS
jgi:hypothetical protein